MSRFLETRRNTLWQRRSGQSILIQYGQEPDAGSLGGAGSCGDSRETQEMLMANACAALLVSVLFFFAADGEFATDSRPLPLFDGLGSFSRKVTTESSEAQRYFDQGLAFMYAFNHDESIRSFRRARLTGAVQKLGILFRGRSLQTAPRTDFGQDFVCS
jgi:hypothetical protein